jgi:hypothetical protein
MYAVFMGAGVAGLAYTKLGRRVGYGNDQAVWIVVGVAFFMTFVFTFTLFKFILHI